jgi:predicted porin
MNKKLVALGVASAFALPLAAEAQTANVTLYGRLNMDLEFINGNTCASPVSQPNTGAFVGSSPQVPAVGNQIITNCSGPDGSNQQTNNPTVTRVSSNSSRFGLRGTESLGGGLNAVFQIESNVAADTGQQSLSNIATRETFVGLQGSWGRFTVGKFLMPMDDLHPIFGNAPTLTTSILSTADVWAQGNLSKGAGGWDARTGNNMRYDTPNFSGFTAAFQASTRDSSGNTAQTPYGGDNGDHASEVRHAWVFGENIIYSNGPIQIGFGAEQNKKVRQYQAVTGAVGGVNCTALAPCTFNADDYDWTVAGSYDFGTLFQGFGLKIGLAYEQTKYDTPSGDLKRDFWAISGTIPIGAGKLYLFFGQASDGKGGAADGETVGYVVHGENTGTRQWEISYSYSLSPRTLLYTGYVKLLNDQFNPTTFNINSYAIATCKFGDSTCNQGRPSGFVLGMVHFF